MSECLCVVKNREDGQTQRDWLKSWMCMHHWMQTDYYQSKLTELERKNIARNSK